MRDKQEVCNRAAQLARGCQGAPVAVRGLRRVALDAGCERRGPVEVAPGCWVFARASGDGVRFWRREPDPTEIRALLGRAPIDSARPRAVSDRTRSEPIAPTSPERERVSRLFTERI